MEKKYKTTFNYLLTHKVLPAMFFGNVDLFYESIIVYPQNVQDFLQEAHKRAAAIAKENPDIEPAYPIEKFDIGLI